VKEKVGVTTGKFIAELMIAILVSCAISAAVCPCTRAASEWSRTYGGAGSDTGAGDIIQTSDGGYVISGDTASFGAGSTDYWLIKTDADGNMEWNKTYGGPLADSESAMCQTIDGGYALAGVTSSFGAGDQDFWLVKIDAAGNMLWNKTYGGSEMDFGLAVVQTSDGGYAFAGVTMSFGAGERDAWLVKTDSAGNMQWNQTYGGTDQDRVYSLVVTSDGGYALGGSTRSFGAGNEDYWIVKTDAAGNMQWNKTYGGTSGDTGQYLIQTAEGGYAITGYTSSYGAGGTDFWLVKTDFNGVMQWSQTYGGAFGDNGIHVIQTVDGGYAMIGYTSSYGAGGTDFWLVKADSSGNAQWNRTYGGTGGDSGWSIIQTIDGGYALAGNTASFGAGSTDFYVEKTDPTVPEGLTVGVMVLLSSVAVVVSTCYFWKRAK
jgi:hypothetical protein